MILTGAHLAPRAQPADFHFSDTRTNCSFPLLPPVPRSTDLTVNDVHYNSRGLHINDLVIARFLCEVADTYSVFDNNKEGSDFKFLMHSLSDDGHQVTHGTNWQIRAVQVNSMFWMVRDRSRGLQWLNPSTDSVQDTQFVNQDAAFQHFVEALDGFDEDLYLSAGEQRDLAFLHQIRYLGMLLGARGFSIMPAKSTVLLTVLHFSHADLCQHVPSSSPWSRCQCRRW